MTMNTKIDELRKQIKVDMHLHNIEDIKAMEGCFGFEGGNKIVNDYMEKFAELIVAECIEVFSKDLPEDSGKMLEVVNRVCNVAEHFGVNK